MNVLCVDIGTTSLKVGIISENGEVVSVLKKDFINKTSKFIAEKWLFTLKSVLVQIEKSLIHNLDICAISISGNGPTIVSSGGLTLLWNKNYKIQNVQTGNSLFLPKLIAFKELFEKEYSRSKYLFSGPEYFVYKLTENAITLLPENRYINAYWNDKILSEKEFGNLKEKLPPFVEIGQKCGELNSDIAKFLKLKEKIPVFCAGPDFIAALIGTNTLEVGKICDRSGSSEGINFCVNVQIFHSKIRTLPSIIPNLWNLSYLIPKSSKLSENVRLEKIGEGIEILKEIANKNNLIFPKRIHVTGGQSKDLEFLQKKSDFLNLEIAICNCNDAELVGDACVAFYGLKKFNSLKDAANSLVKEDLILKPKK